MSTSHTSVQVEIQNPLDEKIGNSIRIKDYDDFLVAEFPDTRILKHTEKADVHVRVSTSYPQMLVININANGEGGYKRHSILVSDGKITVIKTVYDGVKKTTKEEQVYLENWENPVDAVLDKKQSRTREEK